MLNKRRDVKHLPCERRLSRLTWCSVTNNFKNTFNPLPNYHIGFSGFPKINNSIYGRDMDTFQISEIIRKRLNLEDQEWSIIEKNPKFQQLFQNAIEASRYRLVAEVIESKGCHSGHVVGQKLVFDSSGNLLTKENPDRICAFLMPNLTVLINAFFENFTNGRNPNEVMFTTTGCFDTGPMCGGWGHVVVKMTAELR